MRRIRGETSRSFVGKEGWVMTAAVAVPTQSKPTGYRKALVRGASAVFMAAFVAVILLLGHRAACITLGVLSVAIFRELLNVRYAKNLGVIANRVAHFRTVQWGWFAVAMHFAYGSDAAKAPMSMLSVASAALPIGKAAALLDASSPYSCFCSFLLYSAVFIITVVSLRGTEAELRFQITQLCWTIAACLLTVGQMKVSVYNAYSGLFWVVFPALLVAANDTGAYISGKSCGKRFIKRSFFPLSPNKTWEGFVGAALITCAAGFYLPTVLAKSGWLRCSFNELDASGSCSTVSTLFTPSATLALPFVAIDDVERFGFGRIAPIQVHGVVMGLFASLVAPFGGLFASVVKRAYGLKDFDNIIPGHGGVMDRLDCQMVMILFTYVYLTTFVAPRTVPGGGGGAQDSFAAILDALRQHEPRAGDLELLRAALENVAAAHSEL
jgi:phosphatidate cytidylyltransferase